MGNSDMSDPDYLFALKLQNQLNAEDSLDEIKFRTPPVSKARLNIKRSNPHSNLDEEFLNRTQNLVHPQWETLDPTPDIFSLFGAFDTKFFQGRLKCVTLEWSKKMYSCAGICYSRSNRFGMDVTIRLSEPLLKLRPRKDLIETMLHEMIHAYCFVLNIREGNGGHGPNFKRIMYSINKVAGTNITVYHTFYDEVEVYKQHWWRCNGACQNRSPFFGYVKRTSNRAPGANDQWWAAHQEACGGTFMKIKEPAKPKKEKLPRKRKEKTLGPTNSAGDLRKFFTPDQSSSIVVNINETLNGPTTKSTPPSSTDAGGRNSIATSFPPTSYPGLSSDPFNTKSKGKMNDGNLLNHNLISNNSNGGQVVSGFDASNQSTFGKGYCLNCGDTVGKTNGSTPVKSPDGKVDRDHLRNIWLKRFNQNNGNEKAVEKTVYALDDTPPTAKRQRLSNDGPSTSKAAESESWKVVDKDVMWKDLPVETITISDCDSDGDDDDVNNNLEIDDIIPNPTFKTRKMNTNERQLMIKQEIIDENMNLNDEDIILIDDEYNEENNESDEASKLLGDTSVIDEFFGEDTLLADFKRENELQMFGSSKQLRNPDNDIITCPICQQKMRRAVFSDHLNGCTGIAIKVVPPKSSYRKLAATAHELKPSRRSKSQKSAKDILRDAGYSDVVIANLNLNDVNSFEEGEQTLNTSNEIIDISESSINSNSPENEPGTRRHRQRNIFKTTRQCPVCAKEIDEDIIMEHIDYCLSNRKK